MAYTDVLKVVEAALESAEQLETDFVNSAELRKELSALQNDKEGHKLEIDDELMNNIDAAISSGNYDEAVSMARIGIGNAKSDLEMFGTTVEIVKLFSDIIDQAREHILIESFLPKQEQAEVLLEERKLAEAQEVGQKGIESVKNALQTWRPEIEVVFPENLVKFSSLLVEFSCLLNMRVSMPL